jgi:hypothetical protein
MPTTISCPACHRSNDPWRRHCGGCGSGLPGGCKACGAVNRADDRFCGGCAKPLRAMPSIAAPKPMATFDATTPIDLRDVLSETVV